MPRAKEEKLVREITSEYMKKGKSRKEAQRIALATVYHKMKPVFNRMERKRKRQRSNGRIKID